MPQQKKLPYNGAAVGSCTALKHKVHGMQRPGMPDQAGQQGGQGEAVWFTRGAIWFQRRTIYFLYSYSKTAHGADFVKTLRRT